VTTMTTILGISEDHADLREVVWDLLAQYSAPEHVHRLFDSGEGNDPLLDAALAELGLIGIDVPESLGGGDGTFGHVRHVAEGCGWSTAATRMLGTTALIGALLEVPNSTASADWLPRLAAGEVGGAVVMPGTFGSGTDAVTADEHGDAASLTGAAAGVVDLPTAQLIVVLAHTSAGEPLIGLVEPAGDGVTIERQEPLDLTRTLGRLVLEGAPATIVARGPQAMRIVERVVQRASLTVAADSLGVAARVVAVTVEYAKQREQFDRAIGSFQAVKHQAADMLTRTEMARALVDEAATAYGERRPDAALLASMAKDLACGTAAWVAGRGIQLHGGIGYTWEHEMHIYFKRAKLAEMLFGDRRWHRSRITELLRAQRR